GVDLRALGWVDDVRGVLAACDVLVQASDSEGLPTSVLEALAAGVPVVATDVGGTREALGGCGILVAPGDVESLARGIASALDRSGSSKEGDVARGRAHVRAAFDVRDTARRVAAVHRDAMEGRARAQPRSNLTP